MVFFDKFNKENFEVDSQELDVQAVTVSELKKEYVELGTLRLWQYGEQTARKDGKIISRTYKTLSFANNAIDYDFVDLGYTSSSTNDQYEWRVIREFNECERYSSCDSSFGDFKIWEVSDNQYQMEITYDNQITILDDKGNFDESDDTKAIFTWNRPTSTKIDPPLVPCGGGSTFVPGETGDSNYESISTNVKDYLIDIIGLDISFVNNLQDIPSYIADTLGVPGLSTVLNLFPSVDVEDLDIKLCVKQLSLPIPFRLVYDAGKSLGAEVGITDMQPDNVYISKTPNLDGQYKIPTGSGIRSDPYRLEYRYIIFEWDNPGKEDLTTFTVNMLGNEVYRVFTPIERDQEPECPEHLDTTEYIAHASLNQPTRYKPPGEYFFPDNFWNDTVDTIIEDFNGRSQSNPGRISN